MTGTDLATPSNSSTLSDSSRLNHKFSLQLRPSVRHLRLTLEGLNRPLRGHVNPIKHGGQGTPAVGAKVNHAAIECGLRD